MKYLSKGIIEEIIHSPLKLLFLLIIGILFLSCETKNYTIVESNGDKNFTAEYVLDVCSKIIACNIGLNENFEKKFIRKLIDENGLPNRNLFLSEVINSINLDDLQIISDKLNLDFNDLSRLQTRITRDYPSLVIKVPEWCVLLWSDDENPDFSYDLVKSMGLSIIPKYGTNNHSYLAYNFDENLIEKQILKNNLQLFHLPVVLRFSEYHKIISYSDYTDRNGDLITEEPIDTDFKKSIVQALIDKYLVKNIDVESDEIIINWFDFIKEYRKSCWNHMKSTFFSTRSDLSVTNTEICDNNIDDDGDGYVDKDDSDCCIFYSNCIRDCVRDYNYIRGLRMSSINSATVLNQDIMIDDNTHMRIVLNEFNGTGNGSPNKKTLATRFMYTCDQTNMINDYLYRAYSNDEPGENGSVYTGIYFNGPNGIRYINISYANPVIGPSYNVLWKDEWDGDVLGKTIRTDIWYEDAEIENTGGSQMEQVQNSVSTEFGVKFGGGGANGFNPYPGFDIGYSSSNTTTSTTTVTYQSETEARELGNVDLQYCDNNSSIMGPKNCSPRSVYTLLNGKELNTGTIKLYTSIEFTLLPN